MAHYGVLFRAVTVAFEFRLIGLVGHIGFVRPKGS